VTILVPDPGKTEALVRVQARGVCHTDLHYHEGGVSDELPFILGHEAAGIVEAIGRNREVLGANPEWGASPTRAELDPRSPGPGTRPASSRTARHTHRVWSRHLVRRPAQIKNGSLGWVFTALALVSTSGPAPGRKAPRPPVVALQGAATPFAKHRRSGRDA
jgi:NADPH:quinone reductase-like Zn-dependent oxidoreductase